ncbi:MAG: hypothetical protein NC904_03830 [Candidatus Omnitrophica bacterium]|nr:hypothetical protein [Candidatus Omnitrophota bacterium]
MEDVKKLLWEAVGKQRTEVSFSNRFRDIGFDDGKLRLGWVKPPIWELVENSLNNIRKYIENKKEFIFVGIGGSINGVKAVLSLNKKNNNIHCIDNLDPTVLINVLSKIKNFQDTIIVAISKSATTLETQIIARSLKYAFCQLASKKKTLNIDDYLKKHFLWLVDKDSFSKLDDLGWQGYYRLPIQVDGRNDIGGRFSSPHTLIFLLPLFLIMKMDISKVKNYYLKYTSLIDRIVNKAYRDALSYIDCQRVYFSVCVDRVFKDNFRVWITQLFQESMGSKEYIFPLKTFVTERRIRKGFFMPIYLDMENISKVEKLMAYMYYLQNFVAFYSYFKRINFVNQPYVEKYKERMRQLHKDDVGNIREINIRELVREIKQKLKPHHIFIEIIVYFCDNKFNRKLENFLKRNFPKMRILIFTGSDWNHHSYQSAYCSQDTLYVILVKKNYCLDDSLISKDILAEQVNTQKLISYATYLTLEEKAILFSIDTESNS